MKKYIITLMADMAMMFADTQQASAQDFNFDPDQMAQMRVDQMKVSLKLMAEQADKILVIIKKQDEEIKAVLSLIISQEL